MDTQRNALSEAEIIAQANKHYQLRWKTHLDADDLLLALESFYMNGGADETSGDVETFGHFYRVHRWIVWTDSQGFHDVDTYDTEAEAIACFAKYDVEYAKTFDTDECF